MPTLKIMITKKNISSTITVFLFSLSIVLVMLLTVYYVGVKPHVITRDIFLLGRVSPLYGILSNLGNFLWCATGAICLFGAIVIRKNRQDALFLFFASFLSLFLLLDDFFMFHDHYMKFYTTIAEDYLMLFILLCTAYFLLHFRKTIFSSNYLLLLMSLLFLSTSVFIDKGGIYKDYLGPKEWHKFIEDSFKWVGIVFWFAYFSATASQLINKNRPWPKELNSS